MQHTNLKAKRYLNLLLFIILSLFLFLLSSLNLQANPTVPVDTFACTPSFAYKVLPCNRLIFQMVDGPETDSGYTYSWFFGDGSFSSERNPSHNFKKFGKMGVCLNVKGPKCDVVFCDSILLVAPKNYLQGLVFYDENRDGLFQKTEKLLPNNLLQLFPGNIVTNSLPTIADTNNSFNYSFEIGSGDFLLTCPTLESYEYSVPTGLKFYNLSIPEDTCSKVIRNLNFGVYPKDSVLGPQIIIKALNTNRPGKNIKYQIILENNGFGSLNGKIKVKYDPKLIYLYSSLSPYSQSQSTATLQYIFSNLNPFEKNTIEITFNNPIGSLIGDSVRNIAEMEYAMAKEKPLLVADTIKSFFTQKTYQNEISSENYSFEKKNYVKAGDRIFYTIRIQNTKNTSSAKNILLLDTLSEYLDLSTLILGKSSHTNTFTIIKNEILEWNFDKISLTDTLTNEESSHAFVEYSIMPKLSVKNKNEIHSKAFLKFDNNPNTIKTGTITHYIVADTVTQEVGTGFKKEKFFAIFPNPSIGNFYIKTEEANKEFFLRIMDIKGRTIESRTLSGGGTHQINKKLTPGIYIIELKSANQFLGIEKLIIN